MISTSALVPKVITAIALIASGAFCLPSDAKPMPAATDEQAINQPLILEGQYIKVVGGGKEYFNPPLVRYKVLKVWRNASAEKLPAEITISFEFTDGSACMEPSDWKYSTSLLPKPGSVQILFLHPSGDTRRPLYATFRGSFGRWDANAAQLSRLQELLKTKSQ